LIDKEITIFDAVLGGSMEVEHPDGVVTVKIPK
jgi:DnaJ-class molecular chaperone